MDNVDPNATFGWDDWIEDDGKPFVVLPDGEYPFTVTEFQRKRYNGSAKLPPCNEADISIAVHGSDGQDAYITDRFYLVSKSQWKLAEFFRSVGLKKHGERMKPDWNNLVGLTGRVRIKVDTYLDKDEKERKNNKVVNYLDPVPGQAPSAPVQQAYQPPMGVQSAPNAAPAAPQYQYPAQGAQAPMQPQTGVPYQAPAYPQQGFQTQPVPQQPQQPPQNKNWGELPF